MLLLGLRFCLSIVCILRIFCIFSLNNFQIGGVRWVGSFAMKGAIPEVVVANAITWYMERQGFWFKLVKKWVEHAEIRESKLGSTRKLIMRTTVIRRGFFHVPFTFITKSNTNGFDPGRFWISRMKLKCFGISPQHRFYS